MAIAKGAQVIVVRGGVERPGVVLQEVASRSVSGLTGEGETVRRYRVQMPQHETGRPTPTYSMKTS
ncbi:MAG: hypothetical protein ACTHK3_12520 [Solirubrobacterales bacterium]